MKTEALNRVLTSNAKKLELEAKIAELQEEGRRWEAGKREAEQAFLKENPDTKEKFVYCFEGKSYLFVPYGTYVAFEPIELHTQPARQL